MTNVNCLYSMVVNKKMTQSFFWQKFMLLAVVILIINLLHELSSMWFIIIFNYSFVPGTYNLL